jgi:hypothetical protein
MIMKRTLSILSLFVFTFFIAEVKSVAGTKDQGKSITSVTETLSSGSFIVNMGIVTQTTSNGLKPYGLIYDLMVNYQVPVKWIIDQTKAKDGADFTYNSTSYKGGPFIIPAEYITSSVSSRISYWQTQGVQGTYTTSAISVLVYSTLTNFPVIMIDTLAGLQAIIQTYYTNAGIPSTAYTLGSPAGLTQCFDIWTNPHGDPTWSTHGYLYNFVTTQKGWIWGQCHAVSMLEDVVDPSPPYEQLNFLSQTGLKCYQSGGCGTGFTESHVTSASAPYTNYNWTDPEMQYMADLYLATQAGSERWFQPVSTGGWRTTTKIAVTTGTGTAPTQGVLCVYGQAYGDDNYGRVEYVAGHDLTSGGGGAAQPMKVAAQRCYFNFLLLAGKAKQLLMSSSSIPSTWTAATPQAVSVSVSSGISPYTYQWTSTVPGYFYDSTAASTYFYPDSSVSTVNGVLRCIVTDACGRKNFAAQPVIIYRTPLPITLTGFSAEAIQNKSVLLKWSTASEINNDYFTIERSKDGAEFSALLQQDGTGNSTALHFYSAEDDEPFSGISWYRLKQIDYDGRSQTFNPVRVLLQPQYSTDICIYPNPFRESFTAEFYSDCAKEITVELLGLRTKLNWTEKISATEGLNTFRFSSFGNLSSKEYIFRLRDGDKILGAVKLLKE